jgi:ADP-ribose pyrophosphatase YjhB (NUDIX family)
MKHYSYCVILDQHNGLLLLHFKRPTGGLWELPGGLAKKNQSPVEAAEYGLATQLNVRGDVLAEIGEPALLSPDQTLQYHWFLIGLTGNPSPQVGSFDEFNYFAREELAGRTDLDPAVPALLAQFRFGLGSNAQSKLRRTRNEIIIQRENGRLKDLAAGVLDTNAREVLPLSFDCECSSLTCKDLIAIPADEYTKIHDHPGWFAIIPGHEHTDIERVVDSFPTSNDTYYSVVEKFAVRSGEVQEI